MTFCIAFFRGEENSPKAANKYKCLQVERRWKGTICNSLKLNWCTQYSTFPFFLPFSVGLVPSFKLFMQRFLIGWELHFHKQNSPKSVRSQSSSKDSRQQSSYVCSNKKNTAWGKEMSYFMTFCHEIRNMLNLLSPPCTGWNVTSTLPQH